MSGPIAVVCDAGGDVGALIGWARAVADGAPVLALVAGAPEAGSAVAGADAVVTVSDGGILDADPGSMVAALEQACRREGPELVALPATVHWRETAAPLAARLEAAVTSEVTELRRGDDGGLLADRLLYSGLVVATVALRGRPAVVTMALPEGPRALPATVTRAREDTPASGSRVLLSRTLRVASGDGGGGGGVLGARRVVAVGRGLKRREDLAVVEQLARVLDAELAGSRPMTEDLGWLPDDRKVGLSGHTVKPELYVAVGISGQIQHLVGMRDAGVVAAINVDPKAPIFEAADVGVVGDLYEVVPRLASALVARRSGRGET